MLLSSTASVQNFKSKQLYTLSALITQKKNKDQLVQDIYNCCTESLIYQTLFKKRHPDGYTMENAKEFLMYSEEGWQNKTHFIFGIFNSETSQLVGAIDIKSPNKAKAEVGYWLSSEGSGLMTNALIALTKIAKSNGYKSLEVITDISNQRSEAVAKRAGFKYQHTKRNSEGEEKIYQINL